MFYWEYETKRALGLREGEEFSILPLGGRNGIFHEVHENRMSEYLRTNMAQIWTTRGYHFPLPWDALVVVRKKNWAPLFAGIFTVLFLTPVIVAILKGLK